MSTAYTWPTVSRCDLPYGYARRWDQDAYTYDIQRASGGARMSARASRSPNSRPAPCCGPSPPAARLSRPTSGRSTFLRGMRSATNDRRLLLQSPASGRPSDAWSGPSASPTRVSAASPPARPVCRFPADNRLGRMARGPDR